MIEFATAMIEALPDGAIIVNSSGDVSAANAAAVDIFQSRLVGLPVISVIRSPAFNASLSNVVSTKTPTTVDVEFHGRPPRQVNAHIALFGQNGDILIVMRDLNREQAIEKMRSDFVANASHEMRTPLATIIGSIETLQGAAKNDPKARDMFLTTMLSQSHRMKRLIDDLLTLSRIELNEHVRPNGRVALLNVLKQAKANLAQQALDLKVSFILSGDPELTVAGDADELMQVAQNLIENAIKYGGDGGKVELSCSVRGNEAVFAVKALV